MHYPNRHASLCTNHSPDVPIGFHHQHQNLNTPTNWPSDLQIRPNDKRPTDWPTIN